MLYSEPASLQELDDMLSVERTVESKPGFTLEQLWADSESAISKKTTTSYEVQTNDVQRAVAAIQHLPSPIPPDSPFLRALGTTAALKAPPQTDTLAQRALEEWERTLCENKAVAILAEVQASRPTIHKDVAKCSLPFSLTGY